MRDTMHGTVSQARDAIRDIAKRVLAFLEQHKLLILIIITLLIILFALWVVPKWQPASEAVSLSRALVFLGQHKLPILIVIALLIILFALWEIPKWQLASWKASLEPKDLAELENEARRTWAQILGGLVILIGLYFTWQTVRVSQEGQITERFTRAIDQLGNEKLEIRLGGIYALERIARDSERDHWPIMEILTAYVRENAPWNEDQPPTRLPADIPTDIQAILTVLGRRARTYGKGEGQPLDLHGTDIRGANLAGAHLEGAYLGGAHLEEANLAGAHLEGTNAWGVHLEGAVLEGVHLEGAWLLGAHLENVHGIGAHLEGAYLGGAHLEGAFLWEADLRGVKNLETANLQGARANKGTIWPEGFKVPKGVVIED